MSQEGTGNFKRILLILLIIPGVIYLYLPSLDGDWLLDDDISAYKNILVTSDEGFSKIWFSFEDHDYWPMTRSAFRLQYQLFGNNPEMFRIINLLLHFLCAFLIYHLGRKSQIPGVSLAAFIFLIHPVNVNTVAWVSELKNILMTLFIVPAAYYYNKYIRESELNYYGISLAFFLLALASKTAAVFFPFILLFLHWLNKEQLQRTHFIKTAPFFLASLIMGLITMYAQYRFPIYTDESVNGLQRIAICGWTYPFYIFKSFVPYKLSMIYSNWEPRLESLGIIAYIPVILIAGTVITAIFHHQKKWAKTIIILTIPFGAFIFPVLGLFKMSSFQYHQAADFYFYPAVWVLYLITCAYLFRLYSSASKVLKLLLASSTIAYISICASITHKRAAVFNNSESLWSDTLKKVESSEVAHKLYADNLGKQAILLKEYINNPQRGNKKAIKSMITEIHSSNPSNHQAALNKKQKELSKETVETYLISIELNPGYIDAYNNFIVFLLGSGQRDLALSYLEKLETIPENRKKQETYYQAYFSIGKTALNIDDRETAERCLLIAAEFEKLRYSVYDLFGAYILKSRLFQDFIEFRKLIRSEYEIDDRKLLKHTIGILNNQESTAAFIQWLKQQPTEVNFYNALMNSKAPKSEL